MQRHTRGDPPFLATVRPDRRDGSYDRPSNPPLRRRALTRQTQPANVSTVWSRRVIAPAVAHVSGRRWLPPFGGAKETRRHAPFRYEVPLLQVQTGRRPRNLWAGVCVMLAVARHPETAPKRRRLRDPQVPAIPSSGLLSCPLRSLHHARPVGGEAGLARFIVTIRG
jgi:hypothetical protein